MKTQDENKLDATWRSKLHDQEEPVPAAMWDKLAERLDSTTKKSRPMWLHPLPWAAILCMTVGLYWSSIQTVPQRIAIKQKSSQKLQQIVVEAAEMPIFQARMQPMQIIPTDIPLRHEDVLQTVESKTEVIELAQIPEDKVDELYVLVDIQPIKAEKQVSFEPIVDPEPTIKRKSFVGKFISQLKQAVAGEEIDWHAMTEGNPSLERNIHAVANRIVKTEEIIKVTFQNQ